MDSMSSQTVTTERLTTHVHLAGDPEAPPVVLLHGNVSSADFFDRLGPALAGDHRVIAPDLRGFGRSEARPVDATRGLRDFSDDVAALLRSDALGLGDRPAHVVGWSVGGNVALQLAIDHGPRVASLVLLNPGSPYGFGGTRGPTGEPCHADFAGSGGGTANPDFVRMLAQGRTGTDHPASPANVMAQFYWKPPFRPQPEHEQRYLAAMLRTHIDPGNYPGDMTPSPNWPGVGPGTTGINNALSPRYLDQSGFATIDLKPPVLWIRGADDQIVSDRSMFDFGVLGELGLVPGWPGPQVFPAQPMVTQTRTVLDAYRQAGGDYREQILENCGHSPHIEHHDRTHALLEDFFRLHRGRTG